MANYGLIHTIYDKFDWFFGDRKPEEVLQPDGQWDMYLPVVEIQTKNDYDPLSCTSFGTINAVEILMLRKFGNPTNYSERALAIAAGTNPKSGNDPHTVCQAIRHLGLVDEDKLPLAIAKTIEEYYVPNPLTKELVDMGKKWLEKYTFNHYWVFRPTLGIEAKIFCIKQALTFSPVCVSVHAWSNKDEIYYKPKGAVDNHWCVLYGYDEFGNWKIFDSLSNSHKLLRQDYDFSFAKMFSLTLRKKTWLDKLFAIINTKT